MKKSKHGMTSEQASKKKKDGHSREYIRALQVSGTVIKGNGKGDVLREDNKVESVKGGKKTQWGLMSLDSILTKSSFNDEINECLKEYVNFLPEDINIFNQNRTKFKHNLKADKLLESLNGDVMGLIKHFCGFGIIDYYTFFDERNDEIYCVNYLDFYDKIEKSIKTIYTTKGGKIVIKGGVKNTILFELELRKSGGSYKRVLFHSILRRIIDIVK
jgi:hypothetical protein